MIGTPYLIGGAAIAILAVAAWGAWERGDRIAAEAKATHYESEMVKAQATNTTLATSLLAVEASRKRAEQAVTDLLAVNAEIGRLRRPLQEMAVNVAKTADAAGCGYVDDFLDGLSGGAGARTDPVGSGATGDAAGGAAPLP